MSETKHLISETEDFKSKMEFDTWGIFDVNRKFEICNRKFEIWNRKFEICNRQNFQK